MAGLDFDAELKQLDATLTSIEKVLDLDSLRKEIAELGEAVAAPDLWDDAAWHELNARAVGLARQAGALAVLPAALTYRADVHVHAGEFGAAAGLVVPKLESQHQLDQVRQVMAEHARLDGLLVVGLETALGVADARILLARGVSGAYFGAEDFIADIGGRRTSGSEEVLYARSQVCLAARLAGIPAVDQVVTDLSGDEHFLTDAQAGRNLGYQGKICIHPRQVALAHRVFTPTEAEFAHARQVLAAGEAGVGVVDGQMIDDVHVRMARATLARAAPPQSTEPDPP